MMNQTSTPKSAKAIASQSLFESCGIRLEWVSLHLLKTVMGDDYQAYLNDLSQEIIQQVNRVSFFSQMIACSLADYFPFIQDASLCEAEKSSVLFLSLLRSDPRFLGYADHELLSNADFIAACCKIDPCAFEYADFSIRNDPAFVLSVLPLSPGLIRSATLACRQDHELMTQALSYDGTLLEYAPVSMRSDLDIVLSAIHQNPYAFDFVSEDLREHESVLSTVLGLCGMAIKNCSMAVRATKRYVMIAVSQTPWAILYASDDLKEDPELLLPAISADPDVLSQLPECQSNQEIVKHAVALKGSVIAYADSNCKDSLELMRIAVDQDGLAYRYASNRLKNDRSLLEAALAQNGLALQYAPDLFRQSPFLVELAVTENLLSIVYSRGITKSAMRSIVHNVIQSQGLLASGLDKMLSTLRSAMLCEPGAPALSRVPSLMWCVFLSEGIHSIEYSRKALPFHYYAFRIRFQMHTLTLHDEERLALAELSSDDTFEKSYDDFIRSMIKSHPHALLYAPDSIKNNEALMLLVLYKDFSMYRYIGEALRNSQYIAISLLRLHPKYVDYQMMLSMEWPEKIDRLLTKGVRYLALKKVSPDLEGVEIGKISGLFLEYAGEAVKNDPDIARAACIISPESFHFIGESLKMDEDYVMSLLQYDHEIALHIDTLMLQDEDFMWLAVEANELILQYLRVREAFSESFIERLLVWNHGAISYFLDYLHDKHEIKQSILSEDGSALRLFSEEDRLDPVLVCTAVCSCPRALEHAHELLRADPGIVMEAVERDYSAEAFIAPSLREQSSFMEKVMSMRPAKLGAKQRVGRFFKRLSSKAKQLKIENSAGDAAGPSR